MNSILYKNMNKEELDAAYNNTKAIDNFPEVLRDFQARSLKTYNKHSWVRDLTYGNKPRQRFDFLSRGVANAPTYIFIHGGYWSNCNKEDFAFIAEGPVAHGMNVILAEYTLAPEATMTDIVNEIKMLIENVIADKHKLGLSNSPLYLAGHSAGGHLSALYRSHPGITKVHTISALVDLKPISLSWLQDNLKLTAEEINKYSPLLHIQKGSPTLISVGASELSELVRHSTDYAVACEKVGENVGLIHVPQATHFSILTDLADPNGWQIRALMSM
ncbi:alpha/beta hydrolase [Erwinia sp. JUb26]|uniref:alpha/beta hydrolase n=1 Tax=Erwinia sp. JUb26 TaxID=2485126 RepID=UPI000F934409|nr:alpha/beta hydrolase [Erwinia sp. JUb26]ROR06238.1 acetyl esterase/lipase [Erwinia sp. JUb26]